LAELATAQQADNFCQKVQKDLNTTEATRFCASGDGILCRQGHQQGVQQVVVPQSLTTDILQREPSSPLGEHPGATRMYQTHRRRYYWPFVVADVLGWVAACPTCAKKRLMETRSTASVRLFPAKEPSAAVALDLVGPLPRTPKGYEYLLVICDRFTKLTRVVPLKDFTALDVLSSFLDVWIASSGIPNSTLSDIGPQIASVLYEGVLNMLGTGTNAPI